MQADIFHWPVRVYWEDTDAGGIVFYANYLKFFERARTEWLRALGLAQRELRELEGGMFVVSEARVRYAAPARLDDELIVTAQLLEAGRASLTIAQQAFAKSARPAPDTASPACNHGPLLCEGAIRIGWVDAATLRPARIPPAVLQRLPRPPQTTNAP